MLYWRFKYFLQLKAAEGAQYSTEQAIKLEMELVELKAERTVMSLRVSEGFLGKKKPQGRIPTPFPPNSFPALQSRSDPSSESLLTG